jgi:Fic family protein
LNGVVEQARDTVKRCERLVVLSRTFHEKIASTRGSVRLAAIVDGLFEAPVLDVPSVQRRFGVTYPTARSDLAKLEKLEIVRRLEATRQITYFCEPIFDVTFADSI